MRDLQELRDFQELRSMIDWARAERPIPSELISGDRCLVKVSPHAVLFALIDGAGHGEEAALASDRAAEFLDLWQNDPLESVFPSCHQALMETRGAAVSLAVFHPHPPLLS